MRLRGAGEGRPPARDVPCGGGVGQGPCRCCHITCTLGVLQTLLSCQEPGSHFTPFSDSLKPVPDVDVHNLANEWGLVVVVVANPKDQGLPGFCCTDDPSNVYPS